MLSSRSHIAAKAAIALPFNRPGDWTRMNLAAQGPDYLASAERRGTRTLLGIA